MVPGRTRLGGGVVVGGGGLTMADAEVEGVALAGPGPERAHAPSVVARRALSARRPTDAVVIPATRPGEVLNMVKICDPILRPVARSGAFKAVTLLIPPRWGAARHG